MSDTLRQAYAATRYVIEPPGAAPVPTTIGDRHPALDAVLAAHGAATAAFVTAWNPGSRRRSGAANAAAARDLAAAIAAAGWPALPCTAAAPDPAWTEPGHLVIGLGRTDALDLARRFGQNAIVWYAAGEPAEVVYTGCQSGAAAASRTPGAAQPP